MQVLICLFILLVFIAALIVKYVHDQGKRLDIAADDTLTHENVVDTHTVSRHTDKLRHVTHSKDFLVVHIDQHINVRIVFQVIRVG